MKAFFKDIFEYHHHFNQKLADQLIRNEGKLGERAIPLFSHLLNAQQIWNSRIMCEEPLGVHQVHPLMECRQLDRENFSKTLKILGMYELEQPVKYRNSGGEEYQNSVKEILFHIANHTTHHRGQIIYELRQQGIAPIVTDYIFYKR
ncbi:Uncharacterized damage-inducible protein DinB (forms a four-helix bundle) [Salinimicrobium sediminis]|uniref:Uncharacterized damage-inducible protein DinB (Forms a four-helix bundle) n=1 Tax=Salinimicrobium sediminis TaxID=1343891 RepID=A0A285X5B1_9FLAO|nr:DinB family protein [Salinimicrobium sediminis]SOC80502.1 Uncharacterized damage-inducible protein DinB (forms a four-helix bundle) [Salinimicrobium sediminis]